MMSSKSLKSFFYSCSPAIIHPVFKRIETSEVGLRLASGIFWSMAGSVISRGLMLCATVLVARMLGKVGYGELGMIQSTVGMFGVFAGFGLGLTATKHVAEFRKSDPERAGRIIGVSSLFATGTGSLIALGVLVFAPLLAESINAPHLEGVLRIGALIMFINALNGAQTGALAGFEAFKSIAYVNLCVGLISFPILIFGAYFGGLTGAVWGLVINLCFNWLFNHIALRKEVRRHKVFVTFRNISQELPLIWRFTLPATLSGAMVAPANWACRALLTNEPDGYAEIGILTAALVFQGMLLFVGSMLGAPLLSMVSNAGVNVSSKLATFNMLSSWFIGVIIAIPLLCFPEIAQLIFGSDYETRSFQITFSLVVFCSAIIMFKEGLSRVLAAHSLLWWGFLSNTVWAVIFISASVLLVSSGAPGIAGSLAIAYIINTIILLPLYHYRKLIPKKTVLSYESLSIWTILTLLLVLNIIDVSLLVRSFFLVPSILVVTFIFRKILRHA